MIPHITMVVILFLSNTLAIPRPSDKKEVNEESQVADNPAFVITVEGSSVGSDEELEELEEGSGFAFRVQERSGEGSAEVSQEREEVSNLFWRNEEGSGEGSGQFMTLEAEMDSGMDSQVIAKIAEEEEMTTESEMVVNNLQPRFDLEIGSGDSEELFMSFEEEASGDSNNVIKIKTEGIGEGSGAEFRFAEVSNEIGSGHDSAEATVRQVDVNEEIGDITTDFSVRQEVDYDEIATD